MNKTRFLWALVVLGTAGYRLYPLLAPKVKVDNVDVYYTQGATQAEAQATGQTLKKAGFTSGPPKSVRLIRDGGTCHVQFVVQNGVWDRPDAAGSFAAVGMMVAHEALGSTPVVVDMCTDDHWAVKRSQTIDTVFEFVAPDSKDDFWYTKDFSQADVSAVESVLQAYHFKGALFGLWKSGGKDAFSVAVKAGSWTEPKTRNAFKEIGGKVADALHAPGLVVNLCGTGPTDVRTTVAVR